MYKLNMSKTTNFDGKKLPHYSGFEDSIFFMLSVQFSSFIQSWTDPMDCSMPGFPVHHQLQKLAQTHVYESVMPSNHFVHGHPLLLVPSIFSSIRVFSSESVLQIRWSKYWSFSFIISFSNVYSGLFSFRIDWLDLLAVQGILKSLLQYHSSKAPISPCLAFFMIQLSHPYMTTGKTTALARWTFVSKVYAISYSQIHLLIYCNSNTISSKLFCGYVENDSQVYIDFKKTQNSQDNTEEQNQKPYITQLLDLLYSFNDQDSLLVKEYSIWLVTWNSEWVNKYIHMNIVNCSMIRLKKIQLRKNSLFHKWCQSNWIFTYSYSKYEFRYKLHSFHEN